MEWAKSCRSVSGRTYTLRHAGPVVSFLLKHRSHVPLLLRTPCGIVRSGAALVRSNAISGQNVCIESPLGGPCALEAIRKWYGMRSSAGIRRAQITLEVILDDEPRAVLVPLAVIEHGSKKWKPLRSTAPEPLGLNVSSVSRLWLRRIERLRHSQPATVCRLRECVREILRRHPSASRKTWSTNDIAEISQVLSSCGCSLGEPLGRSHVFPHARFRFGSLPTSQCSVGFRRTVKNFEAEKYACGSLPRAVVLTFRDQPKLLPRHVDHFSLDSLQNLLH